MKNSQGSGSVYHQEHAGNVPDYGGNIVDPVANVVNNTTDNKNN